MALVSKGDEIRYRKAFGLGYDDYLIVLLNNIGHTDLTGIRDDIVQILYGGTPFDTDEALSSTESGTDISTEQARAVQSHGADQPARGVYTFPLELIWECEGDKSRFGEIGNMAVLANGGLCVQDIGRRLFHFLNADGKTVRTLGNEESPPVIFTAVDRATLHSVDDIVVIIDSGSLHYFTETGEYIESLPCENLKGKPVSVTFLNRYEYVWAPMFSLDGSGSGEITWCNAADGTERTIGEFTVFGEGVSARGEDVLAIIYPPVTPTLVLGHDHDQIYHGMSDSYRITVQDISGEVRCTFGLIRERQDVSAADKDRIVSRWRGQIRSDMLLDIRNGLPDKATCFSRIEVYDDLIYVFVSKLFNESSRQIDIFNRDGEYLYQASVSVGTDEKILDLDISNDSVYLVLEDNSGIQRIARYRTSLPSSPA